MRRQYFAVALMGLLASAGAAHAQAPDLRNEAFMQAALTVMTFDHFAARCAQGPGFSAADAATVKRWQAENGIAQIRSRLREIQLSPDEKRQFEQGLAQINQKIEAQGASPCAAALGGAKMPAAQFAKVSPQLLAALGAAPPRDPAPQPSAAKPNALAPSASANLATQIDSFGFNSRLKMGIGGLLATDIYPVVLMRNGDALDDVKGLAFHGGLEAHKRVRPGDWTRWRRAGSELQLERKDGWKALPFAATYSKLPDGFRLNGLFRALGGTGSQGAGGNQQVAAWSDYRFSADGTVLRGGGAGSSAEGGDTSVVTSNTSSNRRGRYRIDGLLLHINYDDGSAERRILITDPKDPKSAIWLDGLGYVRREK
jgi:hypothetical protein